MSVADPAPILTARARNRALLARQHLLARVRMPALEMIEHLVGLQSQAPMPPYVGLWSRLDGFQPAELSGLIASRAAVRTWLMRGTIHLCSAADALSLRPLLQPSILRGLTAGARKSALDGIDMAALVRHGRKLLASEPLTNAGLAPLLAARFPGRDGAALAQALHFHLQLVHVPPRGLWKQSGQAAVTPAAQWLDAAAAPTGASRRASASTARPGGTRASGEGRSRTAVPAARTQAGSASNVDDSRATARAVSASGGDASSGARSRAAKATLSPGGGAPLDQLILRYLGAFGPASVADAQAWSGLTRLADAFKRLRPHLATFRSETGTELFDLPDAPRPPEDTSTPARLVAEFDNLILAHADRSHIVSDAYKSALMSRNGLIPGTLLVDGMVAGTWRVDRDSATPAIILEPFGKLSKPARTALEAEADSLSRFLAS